MYIVYTKGPKGFSSNYFTAQVYTIRAGTHGSGGVPIVAIANLRLQITALETDTV